MPPKKKRIAKAPREKAVKSSKLAEEVLLEPKNKEKEEANGEEVNTNENEGETGAMEPAAKRIKFRNYKPLDNNLQQERQEEQEARDQKARNEEMRPKKKEAKDPTELILQEMKSGDQRALNEGDVVRQKRNKPHSDLKAQIEPKLLKLKKKTTRAIVELLRAKLAK